MGTHGATKSATSAVPTPRSNSMAMVRLAIGLLGVCAVVAAFGLVSGARRYAEAGNPYPGAFVSVAEPVGFFAASLAGALCLGALIHVVMTAKPEPDGLIDAAAFRIHLLAERVSGLWLGLAATMVVIQAAHDTGVGPARLLASGALSDSVAASEMARGWIVAAICALVVATALRLYTRWLGHVVLLVPTVLAVVATAVTGNPGQGPDHDYATSAAIVFAVAFATLTGLKIAAALAGTTPSRAVLVTQVTCGALALAYGAMLLYLFIPGWAVDSDFARLGLLAGVILTSVWLFDCWRLLVRPPHAGRRRGGGSGAALAMMAAMASIAAMAVMTAPRFLTHAFTAWDVFLGYELPQPPTIARVLTVWRFDSLIGAAGEYQCGATSQPGDQSAHRPRVTSAPQRGEARRIPDRENHTSGSGVRAYGSAMFSVHMAEHMTLNMFIPVLLVLGGPVTLALRVLPVTGDGRPPGAREWLTWLLHSRVTTFLSHPITAFVLFVASPYIVYFTPLFDTFVRYHWGHEFMAIHFLVVGYLFYWAIIGIDPGPRRLPYPGRIGLLFAVMPFHAFFGIALMTMSSTVGATFYRSVNLPWLSSIIADQHLGGGIAWSLTELPVIMVIVALVTQWARQDRRVASREDRHADSDYADDELEAYNAMLRELSRMRR